eukprot:g1444.t1
MQGETAGRDCRAPERNAPARATSEDRDDAAPSIDDATHGGNRSRGHDTSERDAEVNGERQAPMASDEFPLISVPLDTWVGRYVRITTPRHKGTTGLVHRTGNGWVNLQTSLGDVAKRAYDLVVIPQSRANISGALGALGKGELPRGKRYSRGSKGAAGMGSNSGSADERKGGQRNRSSRTNASTAQSSSDSSGQDDDEEHGNGRSTRRRGRAPMDDGSDYDEADPGDDDEGGNDDHRYDGGAKMRNPSRGGGRGFPGSGKSRTIVKSGGREKGDRDRFGGGEPVKSSGRMSITYTRRDGGGGAGKQRGRGDHDRMRERGNRGEPLKGGAGRERDVMKGDALMPMGRGKEKDSDLGGSRAKRRDVASYIAASESEDKLGAGGAYRERVDRSSNKLGATGIGKKDEEVIKSSWVHQMQRAKERPNLVHWRDELVAITKDSSEDFEDATLSVELMRVRCDVCYHEKSDGDKFCWNADCWMSPVFSGYCHTGANDEAIAPPPAPHSAGYINTFGRETLIDPALTSALQAPVKWLETKRKRKLESHQVFSEDPALYRWQCWASTHQDPNAKDPTFVEDPRFRTSDAKGSKPDPGAADNKFTDAERETKNNPSANGDAMDVALSPAVGAGRPADRNGDEVRRHVDGVDMHTGGDTSRGGWS